jgi:hypothetical protein
VKESLTTIVAALAFSIKMAAARRIGAVAAAAAGGSCTLSNDDDVVIVSAVRTPITKARKGALRDTPPDVLLSTVMKAALEQTGFPAEKLGDICVGG